MLENMTDYETGFHWLIAMERAGGVHTKLMQQHERRPTRSALEYIIAQTANHNINAFL